MDADLRAALFAAIGAAALSALVGAASGVLFGWILLRALLFGAVMGALAFGAARLARAFLPGLMTDRPGEGREAAEAGFSADAPEPPAGSRVDIVLPGEGADAEADAEAAELAEEAEEAGDALAGEGERPDEAVLGEEREEREEREAARRAPAAVPPQGIPGGDARPEGIDDLDILPDLDGFTDSFAAAEFSSSGASADSRAKSEESASARPSDGLDPASLAKAVRTILKRDQKG